MLPGVNRIMRRLIIPLVFLNLIPEELQRTAVLTSRDNANVNKRIFENALENKFVKCRRKEEIALEKKYEYATDDYIVAMYFYEKYHSPSCWLTTEVAAEFY